MSKILVEQSTAVIAAGAVETFVDCMVSDCHANFVFTFLSSLSFAKIANLGLHLPLQGLLQTLFLPTLFFTFFQKDCLQPLSSPHSAEIANLYSSPSAEI
jgi:hypothetical protein